MPRLHPPHTCPGVAVLVELGKGQLLRRIHDTRFGPTEFNPTPRPPIVPVVGGRFDSLDGGYAYLYAADRERGALAEAFARNLAYTDSGPWPLPKRLFEGKAISWVKCRRSLRLVKVYADGAQQLGQDDWLTTCDEDGYPLCREWAEAIRRWVPDADGLSWRSKRDPDESVHMLWCNPLDRLGATLLERQFGPEAILGGRTEVRVQKFLSEWRLFISRP